MDDLEIKEYELNQAEITRLSAINGRIAPDIVTKHAPFQVGDVVKLKYEEFVVSRLTLRDVKNGKPTFSYWIQKINRKNDNIGLPKRYWCEIEDFEKVRNARYIAEEHRVERETPRQTTAQKLGLPKQIFDGVTLVEKKIHPQNIGGVDWGCVGYVLLQKGGKALVWRSGSHYWSSIGITSYAQSDLTFFPHIQEAYRGSDIEIHEGGRLSKKVLQSYDEKIKSLFGIDFELSKVWVRGATVVVEEKNDH